MKPFYKNNGVRLFNGDAIQVLSDLPDNSIDLIFADPPYNLSNDGFSVHAGKAGKREQGKMG